ncbi:phosphatase [Lewinella sp. W8]|uniref:Ppx/GppA phosphatase family protein n=1 Tax=Lewinella sp. W8 TaxID=2528208 RepID=UPI001068328E|nr:phosphatase [Lewinella sp. W8]MTB52629.1 phosphatase [Lewinella sp. W8]
MHTVRRNAVIDLGTNTFHLLIAEVNDVGHIHEIHRERHFVKLAENGIAEIGPAPYRRGQEALKLFRQVLDEQEVREVRAFGTAALRTASNGPDFIREAREAAGIDITLIPGDEEARLITKGVLLAIPPPEGRILIMDIGGGSTEFIIVADGEALWRQSFPVGVSVLHNGFHHQDPISSGEVTRLEDFLSRELRPLQRALERYPAHHLVGAAGTFDVLANVLYDENAPKHPTSHQLQLDGLAELHDRIINSTLEERLHTPGIPAQRADMIVVAMILLRFVFTLAGIRRVTVSDYAMKEGMLSEM